MKSRKILKSAVCIGICLCVLMWGVKRKENVLYMAVNGEGDAGMQPSLEKPQIALTFDDGPNKKYTLELLKGLKKRKVLATFFLMGKNIEGNEEIVKKIYEDGHLIGNHTYNHVCLNQVSEAKAKEEIEKTSNQIFEITGEYPVFIRPPFGEWRRNLELYVDMFPVFWDVDTLDWKSKNVSAIMDIVTNQVRDSSIILMHDSYRSSVDAALKIVDTLKEKGYEFVTVDRLLFL